MKKAEELKNEESGDLAVVLEGKGKKKKQMTTERMIKKEKLVFGFIKKEQQNLIII